MTYGKDGIRVNIMALNSYCVGIVNVAWLCPTCEIFSHIRCPYILVDVVATNDRVKAK